MTRDSQASIDGGGVGGDAGAAAASAPAASSAPHAAAASTTKRQRGRPKGRKDSKPRKRQTHDVLEGPGPEPNFDGASLPRSSAALPPPGRRPTPAQAAVAAAQAAIGIAAGAEFIAMAATATGQSGRGVVSADAGPFAAEAATAAARPTAPSIGTRAAEEESVAASSVPRAAAAPATKRRRGRPKGRKDIKPRKRRRGRELEGPGSEPNASDGGDDGNSEGGVACRSAMEHQASKPVPILAFPGAGRTHEVDEEDSVSSSSEGEDENDDDEFDGDDADSDNNEGDGGDDGDANDDDGNARQKERQRRGPPRIRKMSPHLTSAHESLAAARAARMSAARTVADARRRLEEAQRAVAVALRDEASAVEAEGRAEGGVVDAEIREGGRWSAMYFKLVSYRQRHGRCTVPQSKTETDPDRKKLAEWVLTQRKAYHRPPGDPKSLRNPNKGGWQVAALNRIGFVWNLKEAFWEDRFSALSAYRAQNGDCDVPLNHPDKRLVRWVVKQRTQYANGQRGEETRLAPARQRRLEELGMVWSKTDDHWQARYQELIEYGAKHGHAHRIKAKPGDAEFPLAQWVAKQRRQYREFKAGKKTPLTEERIKKLEEVGFSLDANEGRWRGKYRELLAYREEHGNLLVPTYRAGGGTLGLWVMQQRANYRLMGEGKEQSTLNPERVQLLDDIGFSWDSHTNASGTMTMSDLGCNWQRKYESLIEYKARHGNLCGVTAKRKGDPDLPLAQWVAKQRCQYKDFKAGKKTALTEERLKKLEEVGLCLDANEDKWHRKYRDLLAYKEKHSNVLVPPSHAGGGPLGRWVQQQRKAYKLLKEGKEQSTLTPERVQLLDDVNFSWGLTATTDTTTVSAHWSGKYDELRRFQAEHGHFDVPDDYERSPMLAGWVRKMRHGYKHRMEEGEGGKDDLDAEKIRLLDEIGFDWIGGATIETGSC